MIKNCRWKCVFSKNTKARPKSWFKSWSKAEMAKKHVKYQVLYVTCAFRCDLVHNSWVMTWNHKKNNTLLSGPMQGISGAYIAQWHEPHDAIDQQWFKFKLGAIWRPGVHKWSNKLKMNILLSRTAGWLF
jgi:hypothetical protein